MQPRSNTGWLVLLAVFVVGVTLGGAAVFFAYILPDTLAASAVPQIATTAPTATPPPTPCRHRRRAVLPPRSTT